MNSPTQAPLNPTSYGWTVATLWIALVPLLRLLPVQLAGMIAVIALALSIIARHRLIPTAGRIVLLCLMILIVVWTVDLHLNRQTGGAVLATMLCLKTAELRRVRDAHTLLGFTLMAPLAACLVKGDMTTWLLSSMSVCSAFLSMQQVVLQNTDPTTHTGRFFITTFSRLIGWSIPLTCCAFILLPRLSNPLWGQQQRATQGGISNTMAPGQILDLLIDETPALFVRFHQPPPSPEQMYWRGTVLWDFDGQIWRNDLREDVQLESFRIAPSPTVRYDYTLDYLASHDQTLVALDTVLDAPIGTDLTHDMTLHSHQPLDTDTHWHLVSSPLLRFEPSLAPQRALRALALPFDYNPRTIALGRQWRQEMGDHPRALIAHALDWIHTAFRYSLDTPAPVHDEIDAFLFQRRSGFCEHYSSAFTVLMRAAGLPARVVTGYVGGVFDRQRQRWVVRSSDAHAWSEVWLEPEGWVRIDPTAAVARDHRQAAIKRDFLSQARPWMSVARWAQIIPWMRTRWNTFLHYDAGQQRR